MNNDDFVAKDNYYGKRKEDNITSSDSDDIFNSIINPVKKRTSVIDSYIDEGESFDLSNNNIQSLHDRLQKSINNRTPIFLWSKKRNIEKIRLDNEYQLLLLDNIRGLSLLSNEYNLLQADKFFTEEMIKNTVANNRREAKDQFEKAIAAHKLSLTETKSNIDIINNKIIHDQVDIDRKNTENDKLKAKAEATRADNLIKYAQADKLKAEAESIKSQNELKVMVMGKIDFNNFPPAYISDLLIALAGLNMKSVGDFEMDERMRNMFERMEKSKVDKAEAEVNDFVNSAAFKKWQFDIEKNNPKYK